MKAIIFSVLVLAANQGKDSESYRIYPETISLDTPFAVQKILVMKEHAGFAVEDWTDKCVLRVENLGIARLEKEVGIRPVANGSTVLRIDIPGVNEPRKVQIQVSSMENSAPSFYRHVQPVLTKLGCNSGACHGALAGKGGLRLSLRGYNPSADHHAIIEDLLGRRSDILRPERSLFIRKPLNQVEHGGGKKLQEKSLEYEILTRWIGAGGLEGNKDGPREKPVALKVLPSRLRPAPGSRLPSMVMALYRDGSSEDVSHLAKYGISDESVCGVDEGGSVLGIGSGEGYLTAWHSDQVALAGVSNRFQQTTKNAWPEFTAKGPIDELVGKKWADLGLNPSGRVDDEAFLRRVWVDLLGVLPTVTEREEFLADRSLDKRAKWVDKALRSPFFVDYWTHRWDDLFLVRTGRLQQSAVWSFHQSLRRVVEENTPWDRVVRRMLAGSGSNLQDGLLNLHVLHRDPATLGEAVAVTFLGQPIGCARCHNHPQDKWTQDQYWAFANLFGRTALKTGAASGEIVVVSLRLGDVPHLRTGLPMAPAPLDEAGLPLDSNLDRREHLVRWLVHPDNPFFAKTHVNRVWKMFFGKGLVDPDDDMRATNPPTHPELLDYLAKMWVKSGFDNRALIREIILSETYQRSALPPQGSSVDSKYLTYHQPRRLEAEVLLDAYSQVLDSPTPFTEVTPGGGNGSTPYGGYPKGTRAIQLPDTSVVSTFLDTFGRPERLQACSCERGNDSNVSQALQVSNGPTLNTKLSAGDNLLGQRIKQGKSPELILREIYLRALSRLPSRQEEERFLPLLIQAQKEGEKSLRPVLEDVAWAVLSSTEFLVIR